MSADELELAPVAAREARWSRRRGTRRVGVVVCLAIVAATVVALVTNDRLGAAGTGLDAAGTGTATTLVAPGPGAGTGEGAATDGSGATGAVLDDGALDGGGSTGGSTDPGRIAGGAPPAVGAGVDGSALGGGGGAGAATDAPMVVHPVLQFLAFGGRIGMPLVCTLAASAVGQVLNDPGVAAVLGQIQTACVAGANQGSDSLLVMDQQLAALAALNPAVGPVLDGLASSLEAASQTSAPFASYLLQIVALVRFFQGQ